MKLELRQYKDKQVTRLTVDATIKRDLLPWRKAGLRQTVSGYGRKLTTDYVVIINGKKHRVYCCCWSNSGTLYINYRSQKWVVDFNTENTGI